MKQNVKAKKHYEVYYDDNPENILFEGSRAACIKWIKQNNLWYSYKKGEVRIGFLILGAFNE